MHKEQRIARLREDVCRANIELVEKGLVVFTFGNASGIDRESGIVAIKPSGVDYGELSPGNMVLLTIDGEIVEGDYNPSSDTKTHLKLYNAFDEIGGVVHTHSRHATAWAQAGRGLPCFGTTHADYFYGEIPCTEVISDGAIERDYEDETGTLIIETFMDLALEYRSMKAVLVACHGPFCWGRDVGEAVFISAMLEEVARMGCLSVGLNPDIAGIKQSLLDKHYLRKHGKDAYYGQGGGRSI
jgi:L-ribulose-5-phosphate 4-epimerase